jgi:hypothetical protein
MVKLSLEVKEQQLKKKQEQQLKKLKEKHIKQLNSLEVNINERWNKLVEKQSKQIQELNKKHKQQIELLREAHKNDMTLTKYKKKIGLIKPTISVEEKAKEAGFENIEDYKAFKIITDETNKEIKSKQKEVNSIYKELDKNREKFDIEKGQFETKDLQNKYEKAVKLSDEVNELINFKQNKQKSFDISPKKIKEIDQIPIPIKEIALLENIPKSIPKKSKLSISGILSTDIKPTKPQRRIVKVKKSVSDVKKQPTAEPIIKAPLIPSMVTSEELPKAKQKKEKQPSKILEQLSIPKIKVPTGFEPLPLINEKENYSKEQLDVFNKMIKSAEKFVNINEDNPNIKESDIIKYVNDIQKLKDNIEIIKSIQKLTKVPKEKPVKTPKEKPVKTPKEKPVKEKSSESSSELTEKDYNKILDLKTEYQSLLNLDQNKERQFTKDDLDEIYSYYKEAVDKFGKKKLDYKVMKKIADKQGFIELEDDITKGKELYNKLLKRAK